MNRLSSLAFVATLLAPTLAFAAELDEKAQTTTGMNTYTLKALVVAGILLGGMVFFTKNVGRKVH